MRLRSGRLTALVGSAVTALALVVTACGSNAPAASSGHASRMVLVGGIQTEPNWWFAYTDLQTCSTSNFGIGLLYHGLLYISPQDTINYGRSIASGITTSQNDTVFTIHLKSNWKVQRQPRDGCRRALLMGHPEEHIVSDGCLAELRCGSGRHS